MVDLHEVLSVDYRIAVGNFFVGQDDFATSIRMFESALDRDPTNISALTNGAFIHLKMRDFASADRWINTALDIAPDHPHVLGIKALIVQETVDGEDPHRKFELARHFFERSLMAQPDNITTLLNFAYMLQLIGDFETAARVYTCARDLNVMDLNTRFQRSMSLLTIAETREEWREALDEYEIRHLLYKSNLSNGMKPMYTEHVNGLGSGGLLIVSEQGIGDCVMMARYARFLKENYMFRHVYMLCEAGWVPLFDRVHAFDGVYSDVIQVPPFDYYVPAMSLMRVECWPEIQPSAKPYLESYSRGGGYAQHRAGRPRIGFCWTGNKKHGNDRWRSLNPAQFGGAFGGLDALCYSLQQPHDNELKPDFIYELDIHALDRLVDVISDMDLVVTVDTAVLHIAGALGVPTFALIPSNPDWRWRTGSDKTPWYPSVRLFRSAAPLAWGPVLADVRNAIDDFIAAHKDLKYRDLI